MRIFLNLLSELSAGDSPLTLNKKNNKALAQTTFFYNDAIQKHSHDSSRAVGVGVVVVPFLRIQE